MEDEDEDEEHVDRHGWGPELDSTMFTSRILTFSRNTYIFLVHTTLRVVVSHVSVRARVYL